MLKNKLLNQDISKEITQAEAGELLFVSRKTISKWLNRRAQRRCTPANKTSKAIVKYSEEYWNDGVESLSDRLLAKEKIILPYCCWSRASNEYKISFWI